MDADDDPSIHDTTPDLLDALDLTGSDIADAGDDDPAIHDAHDGSSTDVDYDDITSPSVTQELAE